MPAFFLAIPGHSGSLFIGPWPLSAVRTISPEFGDPLVTCGPRPAIFYIVIYCMNYHYLIKRLLQPAP